MRTVAERRGGEGQWGLGTAVLNVLSVQSPTVAKIHGQAQLHGLSLFYGYQSAKARPKIGTAGIKDAPGLVAPCTVEEARRDAGTIQIQSER